jgi:hypothetical protein
VNGFDDSIMADNVSVAGWNIRIWTFESAGRAVIARDFLAYEPRKGRAIELICKKVSISESEQTEIIAEIAENEFIIRGMQPGDVKQSG